jgi:N6-adenosine-specific RNA methylase IME4
MSEQNESGQVINKNNKGENEFKESHHGKKYDVIYADPPWEYHQKNCRGSATCHYKPMSIEEICFLNIQSICKENAVLFLWVTNPMVVQGYVEKVMRSWGFEPKTGGFTWVKTNKDGSIFMGIGHHTRGNAESCYIGIKGKGLHRFSKSIENTQALPRQRHSKKPDKFRSDLEILYGNNVDRLELFGRERYPGWDVFGDQVNGSIILPPPSILEIHSQKRIMHPTSGFFPKGESK